MKIILNKDVQNLGEEGDVKEVAAGYARNYLIPKGLGITYTKQNLALLDGKRKAIETRKQEKKEHAAGLKERIESLTIRIAMTAGESGRLFGSVTNAMVAEELAKSGIEVERKKVEIPEHTIKTVGNFVVKVKLYGSEVASLKVSVTGPGGAPPSGSEPAKPATTASADEQAPAPEVSADEASVDEASAAVLETGASSPKEEGPEALGADETSEAETQAAEDADEATAAEKGEDT